MKKLFTTLILTPVIAGVIGWIGPKLLEKSLIFDKLIVKIVGPQSINNNHCDLYKNRNLCLTFLSISTNITSAIENEALYMTFSVDSLRIYCTSVCDTLEYHIGIEPSSSNTFGESGIKVNISKLTNSKPIVLAIYANKSIQPENLVNPSMAIANCSVKTINGSNFQNRFKENLYNINTWQKFKFWIFFGSTLLLFLLAFLFYKITSRISFKSRESKTRNIIKSKKDNTLPIDFENAKVRWFVQSTKDLLNKK